MIHNEVYKRYRKPDTASFICWRFKGVEGSESVLYVHSHLVRNHNYPSLKVTILSEDEYDAIDDFRKYKPGDKVLDKDTKILNKLVKHSIHTKTVRYDDYSYSKSINSIYIPFEFFDDTTYPEKLLIGIECF